MKRWPQSRIVLLERLVETGTVGVIVSALVVARVHLPEGEDDLRERRLHRRAPVHDVGAVVEDAVVVAQPDDRRVGRVERGELLTSRVEEGERPNLGVLEVHLGVAVVGVWVHLRVGVHLGRVSVSLGPGPEREGQSESSPPETSRLTLTVPAPIWKVSES